MYKVGDVVKVKKDLVVGEHYGNQAFVDSMCRYRGNFYYIKKHSSCGYYLDSIDIWEFTNEMLEPVKILGGKDMKKSDLKSFQTAALRNGWDCKIIKNVDTDHYANQEFILIPQHAGFIPSTKYNDDLTSTFRNDYDIVEIFDKPSDVHLLEYYTDNSLWKRKEPKKLTVAEANALLKALGEEVEIINE